MDISNRIRQARRESGKKGIDIARAMDVSTQTVSRWEHGTRRPTLENLEQLATLTGKPLIYFVGDSLLPALNDAFTKAEQETATHFDGATCSMPTIDGDETCPICYFRGRVKVHLGLGSQKASE